MEKLTVKAIKDFKTCARLYDYRHIDKELEPLYYDTLLMAKYNATISKVMYFFFFKKMGGQIPSFNALINRWEKLWFKNVDIFEIEADAVNPQKLNVVTLNTIANTALLRFYEQWSEDEGIPLAIALDSVTPINDDLFIEDVVDLTIRYPTAKGNIYKVIKFYTDTRKPNVAGFIMDFANIKANFNYRNEEKITSDDDIRYYLYDIGTNQRHDQMLEMKVMDEDISDLYYWAAEIQNEKVFPSRRGLTIACKTCPFDAQCRSWVDWHGRRRVEVR